MKTPRRACREPTSADGPESPTALRGDRRVPRATSDDVSVLSDVKRHRIDFSLHAFGPMDEPASRGVLWAGSGSWCSLVSPLDLRPRSGRGCSDTCRMRTREGQITLFR